MQFSAFQALKIGLVIGVLAGIVFIAYMELISSQKKSDNEKIG